jgi:hypothetical protein
MDVSTTKGQWLPIYCHHACTLQAAARAMLLLMNQKRPTNHSWSVHRAVSSLLCHSAPSVTETIKHTLISILTSYIIVIA